MPAKPRCRRTPRSHDRVHVLPASVGQSLRRRLPFWPYRLGGRTAGQGKTLMSASDDFHECTKLGCHTVYYRPGDSAACPQHGTSFSGVPIGLCDVHFCEQFREREIRARLNPPAFPADQITGAPSAAKLALRRRFEEQEREAGRR